MKNQDCGLVFTSGMNFKSVHRLRLLIILAITDMLAPKIFGTEGSRSESTVAPPPATLNAQSENFPDPPPKSTATRLGIKFSPPPKETESVRAVVAAQVPHPTSADPTLPDILFLTPIEVSDKRSGLTERAVLTDKAKLEIAEKKMLTPLYRVTIGPLGQLGAYYLDFLSIFGGWHPNEAEAITLYRQEERLRMLGEMDDLIQVDTLHDTRNTKQLQRVRFGALIETR